MKQNDHYYRFDRIRNTVNENLGIGLLEKDAFGLDQAEIDRINTSLDALNGHNKEELDYLAAKELQIEQEKDQKFEETMRLLSGRPVKVFYNRNAEDLLELKQECFAAEFGEEARQSGAFYWGFNKMEVVNGNLVVKTEEPKWREVYPEMKIVY